MVVGLSKTPTREIRGVDVRQILLTKDVRLADKKISTDKIQEVNTDVMLNLKDEITSLFECGT